jgi:F0F1-type ATP synthase membrane subunit b/b'
MSATESPEQPGHTEETGTGRRPWLWMAVSAVLLAVVVALGVWTVALRQDLDDRNAEVEHYQSQSQKVVSDSEDLSVQIDQLTAAIDDTSGRLDEAIAAGQQSADELRGKATDANQRVDDLRQKAADAQEDARGAVDSLDTRMSDLAVEIKAKLVELKAAAEPSAAAAAEPTATPEDEPDATPEDSTKQEEPQKDGDADAEDEGSG